MLKLASNTAAAKAIGVSCSRLATKWADLVRVLEGCILSVSDIVMLFHNLRAADLTNTELGGGVFFFSWASSD